MEQNITNSNIHDSNTKYGSNFLQIISNLSPYQAGSYHKRLEVFNSLPTYI